MATDVTPTPSLPAAIREALREYGESVGMRAIRVTPESYAREEAARTALESHLRALVADSERLDYLQDGACNVRAVMDMDPEAEVGFIVSPYNDNEMPGATLRDAIDACMHGTYTDADRPRVRRRSVAGYDYHDE